MANLHYRHADTGEREHVSLRFFQNRDGNHRRAGAEIKDAFSHKRFPVLSVREFRSRLPPARSGSSPTPNSCVGSYYFPPDLLRRAIPATRKTSERGARRSLSTIMKLLQPEITELLPRARARRAVSTTASGVCTTRAGGFCI